MRHSHGPNCVVKKQHQATREPEVQNVANDVIEYEVQVDSMANERSEQPVEKPLPQSWCRMPSDFLTHQYAHIDGQFA